MLRIVAGELKGRRLRTPPGSGTRPTTDRVREALFNTLGTLTDLAGARFADLYAGSGAVGLEAYSRGAGHVLLVESHRAAAATARANLVALRAGGAVRLITAPVAATLAAGPGSGGPYGIVFADPPYRVTDPALANLQRLLLDHGWLAADAVLVIERPYRSPPPPWVDPVTQSQGRRYGETMLWYGQRS